MLDYKRPDGDGLSVLQRIREQSPDTLVIMMTGFSTIETAVDAMKKGAHHYINKPVNLDEVALLVEKALETSQCAERFAHSGLPQDTNMGSMRSSGRVRYRIEKFGTKA